MRHLKYSKKTRNRLMEPSRFNYFNIHFLLLYAPYINYEDPSVNGVRIKEGCLF